MEDRRSEIGTSICDLPSPIFQYVTENAADELFEHPVKEVFEWL